MLPNSHRPYYQAFYQFLQHFQSRVSQANPDAKALQIAFLDMQQYFQQQIASLDLDADDLASEQSSKVRSLQTEINKQLRLLATDVMFLQTARQPLTVQQRQGQMGDRLQLLQRYCEALLQDESTDI